MFNLLQYNITDSIVQLIHNIAWSSITYYILYHNNKCIILRNNIETPADIHIMLALTGVLHQCNLLSMP